LDESEFESFKKKVKEISFPYYKTDDGIKIPAAWLVEQAGFGRGYKRSGAGISANHSLAIINFGGTSKEILNLALEIENEVMKKFGIRLHKEPVVVKKDN
jgi:UDP-N-acetylmuramate dehydrogenase